MTQATQVSQFEHPSKPRARPVADMDLNSVRMELERDDLDPAMTDAPHSRLAVLEASMDKN